MRDRLLRAYQTYSLRSGITPSQSALLAEAACILGSRGIPVSVIRNTVEELEAAFENSVLVANNSAFGHFRGPKLRIIPGGLETPARP
ncbi:MULTISPECIES: hypothetical protein [Bradyrhizobium]|nr:hypothetical protein XF16B_45850 [Bradyrhizobium diazoefficiens]BCF70238.1 hypothetical protein XF19B_45910 [Bradyrhizobium diazoefficiens]